MTNDLTPAEVASTLTPLEVALTEIETLNRAMATRGTIGQAIGILMVEMTITDQDAFAHLASLSSHSNTKVRDVADAIVQKVNDRAAGRTGGIKRGTSKART